MFLGIVFGILWCLVGLAGWCFFWTLDMDLDTTDLAMGIVCSPLGPLAWVLGFLFYLWGKLPDKVWIHSREDRKPKIYTQPTHDSTYFCKCKGCK